MHHHCEGKMGKCSKSEEKTSCSFEQELKDCAFQKLANQAWKDVLVEKIKHCLIEEKGEQIERLAKILAKENIQKWKYKLAQKNVQKNFEREVENYISEFE